MPDKIPAKIVFTNPINFLAFGFGSGLTPKAPGTFGTLACIPLYWLIADFQLTHYLAICLFVSIIGIFICGYTSKQLKVHDHPGIVWDEFAGYLITMIGISFSWVNVLLGFILFRLFDILKPWPINSLDKRVTGGFGIMIDDVLAGLFALGCLHLILYLI